MNVSLAYSKELVPANTGDASFHLHYEESASFFAGHYPHFAIVPGVLLVEAAWRAVAMAEGREGLTLAEVSRARFLRPVLPGETITVTILRAENHGDRVRARTRVTVRDEPVATVTLVVAPGTPALGDAPKGSSTTAGDRWDRDLLTVLPHRFPLLCVDAVDHLDSEGIVARKAVNVNDLGLRGVPTTQALPASLMIESWCQAAGILAAQSGTANDAAGGEVMLFGGISTIEIGAPARPGQVLVHHARFSFEGPGITLLEGWSEVDGAVALRVESVTLAVRPAADLTSENERAGVMAQ